MQFGLQKQKEAKMKMLSGVYWLNIDMVHNLMTLLYWLKMDWSSVGVATSAGEEVITKDEEEAMLKDDDGAPILQGEEEEALAMQLPATSKVKVGKFADIRKLMEELAPRTDSFCDLELVCGADGQVLKCHKFIIGAQSSYLHQLMLSVEQDGGSTDKDNRCRMHFPDVQKEHMEVILNFLYTG